MLENLKFSENFWNLKFVSKRELLERLFDSSMASRLHQYYMDHYNWAYIMAYII